MDLGTPTLGEIIKAEKYDICRCASSVGKTKRNGSDVLACDVFRCFGFVWFIFGVCDFGLKLRDEFTPERNIYVYIYIYIYTASVVKRARMLVNSIGSSWEGFGWTISTILVRTRDLLR